MALLAYNAPVNYDEQLETFKDFLKGFKTVESASASAATEALEDLHIDGGERTSDEYDFMDDAEDGNEQTEGRRGRRGTKLKYMEMLQDVANRERANVLIELDDLVKVRDTADRLRPGVGSISADV